LLYFQWLFIKVSDYVPYVVASIVLLYYAIAESSKGATRGKSIMGISVSDLEGQPISFFRAILRNLGKLVSALPLCGGYIMAFFTGQNRALHDLISGTMVMDSHASLAAASDAGVMALESDDAPPPPDPSLSAFGHTQGVFANEPAAKAEAAALESFGALAGATSFGSPEPAAPTAPPKVERKIPKGMFPCPSCGSAAGQYQNKCFKCGTKLTVVMFKQYMAGK